MNRSAYVPERSTEYIKNVIESGAKDKTDDWVAEIANMVEHVFMNSDKAAIMRLQENIQIGTQSTFKFL